MLHFKRVVKVLDRIGGGGAGQEKIMMRGSV